MVKKIPTMNDVAKAAGVSRAAVSAVLNDASGTIRVSEQTQARVRGVARELGYIPNPLARGLRRNSSRAIGFVPMKSRMWVTPMENPVQYLLGTHIAQIAVAHGFHVVETSAETEVSRQDGELLEFMRARMVDGVIFHGPDRPEEVQQFIEAGIPVVQLMRPVENSHSYTITVDPAPGILAAVEHLSTLGHQKIAFIGASKPHANDLVRLETFRQGIEIQGLKPENCPVIDVETYYLQQGRRAAIELLRSKASPTAIIAGGDVLGLAVLHAAYELGVRIPDHLSLISYDNTFADSLYPAVTSISQPYKKIAQQAVQWISDLTDAQSTSLTLAPKSTEYLSDLVVRDSTSHCEEGGADT